MLSNQPLSALCSTPVTQLADASTELALPTPAVSYLQQGGTKGPSFPRSPPSALHTPLLCSQDLHSAIHQQYCAPQRFAGDRRHLDLYGLNTKLMVCRGIYKKSCTRQKTISEPERGSPKLQLSTYLRSHYLTIIHYHGNKMDARIWLQINTYYCSHKRKWSKGITTVLLPLVYESHFKTLPAHSKDSSFLKMVEDMVFKNFKYLIRIFVCPMQSLDYKAGWGSGIFLFW